jgi:RNA polymerase sigma-70 factor, ECF subfamily
MPSVTMSSSEPEPAEAPQVRAEDLEIYRRDLIRRAVPLTGGNTSQAMDLVQDTFERALKHIHRLLPGSNIRAWLYTIMVRRYRDILRQDHLRRAELLDEEKESAPVEIEPPPAWMAISTEQVRAAIVHLSPELRLTFERREFDHRSYERISQETGVPTATVGTRLRRARLKLRDILSAQLNEEKKSP